MNTNVSYREVIPKNLSPEEWIEIKINTGTQSTLQDIKISEKSGGFCYKRTENVQNKNRFIYWRTYQDVLELSEISLDFTLLRSNLRLRFTDSAVLNVSLTEQAQNITILVVTVSSLHRFVLPFKSGTVGMSSSSMIESINTINDSQPHSIFYDVNEGLNDPNSFYMIDGNGNMPHNLPHVAVSYLAEHDQQAYFAVAYQNKLMLHIMDHSTANTVSHEVKEPHLMPRFLSNLKGALIGRGETVEAAISMAFTNIDGEMYLLALYRNDELRLWSVETMQNVCSIYCVGTKGNCGSQGPQNNLLRKIDSYNFCVFLSHDVGAEFICISILSRMADTNAKTLCLTVQHSVPAPQMDLSDFDATSSNIWALWSNAEGEFNVSTVFLGSDMAIKWVSAALEPPPDRYSLNMEQGLDPREAYCSYIFHPGRFDRNVIAKALYMFRRVNMRFDVKQLTMSALKEQVCQALEDEIQNELKDFVVSDEEYLEIATRLWDRFYSCCEQYHLKFSEPTGLAVLNTMDAVCIIRRQSFALLRPCEILEHLMLIGDHTGDMASFVAPFCASDSSAAVGFVKLMKIITLLEKLLSEDVKMELDKKLYQQQPPIDVISLFVDQIIGGEEDGLVMSSDDFGNIKIMLQDITNLESAVELLLDLLCMTDKDMLAQENPSHLKASQFLISTGALFGSEYGLSVLTESIKQIAMIRFAVCRNLLTLQYIVHGTNGIGRKSILTNINFLKSYYTLIWIATTSISLNAPANFEASMQRLIRAQLFSGYIRPYSSNIRLHGNTTVLHLFLQSKGLFSALSTWLNCQFTELEQPSLRQTLLQLVALVNQMLWPEAKNYIFLEWLFATCHHVIIQDYVRILNKWCTEKSESRTFMLAVILLDAGEPEKAVHLFQKSSAGVINESFLFNYVLKNTPLNVTVQANGDQDIAMTEEYNKQAIVLYYQKVIQLFEQHSALDYIIELAHKAMGLLQADDPQLPMFQSIVFNNHLQLGHYEEAYYALVYNADTSRRKDCLRQLVITLFQCRGLDMLMRFPYTGLQDDFENIVESRARSLSIDQNEAYNFLYSFHTTKGNMRKAATAMYEQAMRLQVDSDGPNALEKRCSSLLVCINSLHLVDKRYQWIAKPAIGDEQVVVLDQEDDEQSSNRPQQEVVVLELADIRRELLHAEALRELSHHRKDISSYELAGAEELSYLLASCGLYTAALKLARGHNLSVLPIFESLAATCVSTTEERGKDAWSWLQDNDLADLPHRSNATDMAWALLQKLVVDNELNESTLIRKSVVNRLLTLNAFVPQWLCNSYKLANCRELLQLFVKHNRLLEASDLACEMICGMLGAGSEYFDFKHSVAVTNPQLSFPLNTIDLLLHGLEKNGKEHLEYEMARIKLEEEVIRYIETVKRTTDDKFNLSILKNGDNRRHIFH